MRLFFLVISFVFTFTAFASFDFARNDQRVVGEQTSSVKTLHFEIRFKEGQTSLEEAQIVANRAEVFYGRLENYLNRTLKRPIVISLEGDRGADASHRWPYMDVTSGWIHLFRFPEDIFSYQTGLSHEMVHAFRYTHLMKNGTPPTPTFVFIEEGISEYISNVIEPC